MLKPDLKEIEVGTIFQINPGDKTDPVSIRHGGDFLIINDLDDVFESGVRGYLSIVGESEDLRRHRGLAFMTVKWNLLEVVGKVEWIQLKIDES